MSTHPFCNIVIPIKDALPDLRECLQTLEAHTTDYGLILVDDCSGPETVEFLREYGRTHPSTVVIRANSQRWFTRASNLGLRLVRTQRTCLLNSDTVLDTNWLEELFAVWDECQAQQPQRRIGLVGSVQSAEEPRRYAEIVKPGYVTGHCLLLSMDAIADVAGRRGMPGWYFSEQRQDSIHIRSDMFLSYDLQDAGYATIASFKSACGHKGFRSWNADLGKVAGLRIKDHLSGEVISG
jgi:glycosyltransferase involved in cell wall biosynthesis